MEYMEQLEKDMTTEVVEKPNTRKEAILLIDRLKALDFGNDWNYMIFWNKNTPDMSAANINEEFENITNPVQKFKFSENSDKIGKVLDKSAGFGIWNNAINNFNLSEDSLIKYKMTIMHELGHSFARFKNGYMVRNQHNFNYITESLFKLAIIDKTNSKKKYRDGMNISYRYKYQEAFADNYMLSRIPFIFHKRFDKLEKKESYNMSGIVSHIIRMYNDQLINKSSPNNNFIPVIYKEVPNYDRNLYFLSKRLQDIFVVKDYEACIDKLLENKNYQQFRHANFDYLNALVDEDDYKLALFIMAIILNQLFYKITFLENVKMLRVFLNINEIHTITTKNKQIHPSWSYVYGDNFAMAEFPKVWQSLIDAKLI